MQIVQFVQIVQIVQNVQAEKSADGPLHYNYCMIGDLGAIWGMWGKYSDEEKRGALLH